MPIEFACPSCGATLSVPDASAGKTVRCGGCRNTCPAPAAEPPDESPRRHRRWMLALVGGVTLLFLAGVAAIVARTLPRWRPYESPSAGFRVELPTRPQTVTVLPAVRGDVKLDGVRVQVGSPAEVYTIGVATSRGPLPMRQERTDEQALDDAVKWWGSNRRSRSRRRPGRSR